MYRIVAGSALPASGQTGHERRSHQCRLTRCGCVACVVDFVGDVVHDAIELWEPRDHMRCAAYHPALQPCMIGDRARPRIARRQDCDREQVRRYQRRARQLTVGWRASVNRSCQLAQVAAVPFRRSPLVVLQAASCAVAASCSSPPAPPRHLVMQLCSRDTLMIMRCLLSIHAALHGYLKHSIQFSCKAKRLIAR